jgi:hypothetical protein
MARGEAARLMSIKQLPDRKIQKIKKSPRSESVYASLT